MASATTVNPTQSLALFLSDVHLSPLTPKTTDTFLAFLANEATKTQKLYILGDLFEYWAGDDDVESIFNQKILLAIRQLHQAGVAVFWTPGNRDFLTSDRFANASAVTFMSDLDIISVGKLKIAISHGDEQCLDDTDYVTFRAMVRNPQWQQQFLSMPLEKRKAVIESFRKDSRKENEVKPQYLSFDLSASAINTVFSQTGASVFIHGHTHRPGMFQHDQGIRYCLPNWDLDTTEKMGGWLELTAEGLFVQHNL